MFGQRSIGFEHGNGVVRFNKRRKLIYAPDVSAINLGICDPPFKVVGEYAEPESGIFVKNLARIAGEWSVYEPVY